MVRALWGDGGGGGGVGGGGKRLMQNLRQRTSSKIRTSQLPLKFKAILCLIIGVNRIKKFNNLHILGICRTVSNL